MIIRRTYADALANSIYALASAADLIAARLENVLLGRGSALKNEKKRLFNRLFSSLKAAALDYEQIGAAIFEQAGNGKNYEESQEEDNFFARVWLLYYDRVLGDPKAEAQLYDYLQSLPSREYIKPMYLENFYLKKWEK